MKVLAGYVFTFVGFLLGCSYGNLRLALINFNKLICRVSATYRSAFPTGPSEFPVKTLFDFTFIFSRPSWFANSCRPE